jgi:hypothetical protein
MPNTAVSPEPGKFTSAKESIIPKELPDHVAAVVGLKGFAEVRPQDSGWGERNVLAVFDQNSVARRHNAVCADNLAVIVDATSCS